MTHRRREPAPGVFRLVLPLPFPGFDRVNAYLLADDRAPVLVDCGIYDPARGDGGWEEVAAACAACDVAIEGLGALVVTHPHIDHYGMAGRVVEAAGCGLWMHETVDIDLEMYRNPPGTTERLKTMLRDHGFGEDEIDELSSFEDWGGYVHSVIEPSRRLSDGDSFTAGSREWRVLHTPGHAGSHVCLHSPSDGLLISGDHLLPTVTPHIDFKRGQDDPLGRYLSSLKRVEQLGPTLVLPGHGRPFDDGADRARITIRHHDRRLGSILQVIRSDARTASEITDAIFGETLLNFQRRLAFGEALAHLAHLRRTGEAERIRRDDGTFAYRKVRRRREREEE